MGDKNKNQAHNKCREVSMPTKAVLCEPWNKVPLDGTSTPQEGSFSPISNVDVWAQRLVSRIDKILSD